MNTEQFRQRSKLLLVQADRQAVADRIRAYAYRHKSRFHTKQDGRRSYRVQALAGTLPLKPGKDVFGRTHRGDDARTPVLRPTPYASPGKYRLPGGTQVLKHVR